jgi:signal transduction histidine kinase
MDLRRLPLVARIFLLLMTSLLFVQVLNVALLLSFPPKMEPVFTLVEIKAALIDDAPVRRLRVRRMTSAEIRPQEPQLAPLRDQLAARLGIVPDTLNVEFAKPPSAHVPRSDKSVFDASRLLPEAAPRSAHVDPQTFGVSGHFKIGRLLEDGSWRVISPDDSFFAAWHHRALVWLIATTLLAIPAALLLASWLSAPIRQFGAAAERLGRNLAAPPLALDGPAEIVGAARAFNEMKGRLSRYVDDRVAMMGAIAHDLRVPLTRLTFRMEKAPDDLRIKAEADIAEMRQMLAAVLSFVQTLQSDRPRQRQDLRSLIVSIADDQTDIGNDVVVEDGPEIILAGDSIGLRSLFTNLIQNAVAYGGSARVKLRRDGGEAIIEVEDEGPGLPPEDLERAFEPFYRSEPSRNRSTGGIGLGLALVRSVAIAHGGYAMLENRIDRGLRARVALPL